jgi:hypothetical protein
VSDGNEENLPAERKEPSAEDLAQRLSLSSSINGLLDDVMSEFELRVRDSIRQGKIRPMTEQNERYPLTSLGIRAATSITDLVKSNSSSPTVDRVVTEPGSQRERPVSEMSKGLTDNDRQVSNRGRRRRTSSVQPGAGRTLGTGSSTYSPNKAATARKTRHESRAKRSAKKWQTE